MKNITLRKDGRYVIRKTINGKQITKYASNITDAKKQLTLIKKNININTLPKNYSLKKWALEWLEIYKKPFMSTRAFKNLKNIVNLILKKFNNIKLNQINTTMLQEYLNSFKMNKTKCEIQLYYNALLQKAEDLSLITKNPFKGVIKEKKPKYKSNGYNIKEQELIINSLKESEIECEILVYLMTGCRPNELPAKGNFNLKERYVIIKGTKNENAKERIVQLSEAFSEYLKIFFKDNNFKNVKILSKAFKEICMKNNIEKPLLYRLRHTFATNHFVLGTNAKYVQEWLGHYSVAFTLDTYTDIDRFSSAEKIHKLYNNFYFEPK